jgi:hypothetical protein
LSFRNCRTSSVDEFSSAQRKVSSFVQKKTRAVFAMAGVVSSEPSILDHDRRSQEEEEIARRADEAEHEARGAAAPPADGENRNEYVAPFSSAPLAPRGSPC